MLKKFLLSLLLYPSIAAEPNLADTGGNSITVTTDHLWQEMVYLSNTHGIEQKGSQLLHFKTRNRDPLLDDTSGKTAQYVAEHLQSCKIFYSDAEILQYAVEQALNVDGYFLEFGVGVGKTTNFIAALMPHQFLHGFDWFCGLPKDWKPECSKGTFAFKDKGSLPPLLANVLLHVGLFENILPIFSRDIIKKDNIAFIHVDCDLYESTKSIFDNLADNIHSGTIIIFDEYFGYNGWQEHEFKAFQEFITARGLSYEYLAYNAWHEQVVVRIKSLATKNLNECAESPRKS